MGRANFAMKAGRVVVALAAAFALVSGAPASGVPVSTVPLSSRAPTQTAMAPRAANPGSSQVRESEHGATGNHQEWLHTGYLRETLDAMIADGRVEPMVAVMPEAGNSWYVDSKSVNGPGDYETAIAEDLVAEIDKTLRTKPGRWARGIGGLSMGGFGALRLAFREPFRYGAVASFSGAFWASLHPDSVLGPRAATL